MKIEPALEVGINRPGTVKIVVIIGDVCIEESDFRQLGWIVGVDPQNS